MTTVEQPRDPRPPAEHASDFTEENYRELLRLAKQRRTFESYDTTVTEPHLLWRHDVDMSVHRALRLAEIEAEEGVRATYFFRLNSEFYNVLEREVADKARAILGLGHDLGLHFELAFWGQVETHEDLEAYIAWDRAVLERVLGAPAVAVSFHEPEWGDALRFDEPCLAGLVNTYSSVLREKYAYASDSNGYWRYWSLPQALDSHYDRVQVLTHPEWWTDVVLQPRDRVNRCIDGRADRTGAFYDALLAGYGRVNVR